MPTRAPPRFAALCAAEADGNRARIRPQHRRTQPRDVRSDRRGGLPGIGLLAQDCWFAVMSDFGESCAVK